MTTDDLNRRIVADAADAKKAGALIQSLLSSGSACMRSRTFIPDAALVQTTDTLIDLPQHKAYSLTTTSIGQDARGPMPGFHTDNAMRLPMETAEGVFWAEIENVTLADLGYGMLLAVGGITACENGETVLDAAQAVAATPAPLRVALEKVLADAQWQDRGYRAPARAFVHQQETAVELTTELGVERGPGTTRIRMELALRPNHDAEFPPWPEIDKHYDPDSFARSIDPTWPGPLSLSQWWRGS
jgi:hypothetical protein